MSLQNILQRHFYVELIEKRFTARSVIFRTPRPEERLSAGRQARLVILPQVFQLSFPDVLKNSCAFFNIYEAKYF